MKFRRFIYHLLSILFHLILIGFGVIVQLMSVFCIGIISLIFGGHTRGAIEAQNIVTINYLKAVQELMLEVFKE